MGKLDTVGQKVKGTLQQVQGSLEVASGHTIKGNIDKLRGKANVFEADLKMKVEEAKK